MAPIGVCDQLFNLYATSGILDFEGFMKVIDLIKAKNNDGKIELILKVIYNIPKKKLID